MRENNLHLYIFIAILIGGDLMKVCNASCEEDVLIQFLANIQVLSPENIIALAVEEMDTICSKIEVNLKQIGKSYSICRSQNPNDLYVTLIAGVSAFNEKMCCNERGFYGQFELYRPCLYELRNDFEACNGPADWTEEADSGKLCKAYKNMLDCYYIKAAKVCGKEAALIITNLMMSVTEKVIGSFCKRIKSFPYVKDVMPEKYINRDSSSQISRPFMTAFIGSVLYSIL